MVQTGENKNSSDRRSRSSSDSFPQTTMPPKARMDGKSQAEKDAELQKKVQDELDAEQKKILRSFLCVNKPVAELFSNVDVGVRGGMGGRRGGTLHGRGG